MSRLSHLKPLVALSAFDRASVTNFSLAYHEARILDIPESRSQNICMLASIIVTQSLHYQTEFYQRPSPMAKSNTMNGSDGTKLSNMKEHFSPEYYGDASGLKIVKSFKRVGKGYNKPKSKINNAVDMKSLKESSRFSGHVQTSSEEEITAAPRRSKDTPVNKVAPLPLEDTNDNGEPNTQENDKTLVHKSTALKDNPDDQAPNSIYGDAMLDVTLPGIHFGPEGDILALRCDSTCHKRSNLENSPLPGAHLWCRTHHRYHCIERSSKPCDLAVFCAISVDVYARMRVTKHRHGVRQGEEENQPGEMEISSDEDIHKAIRSLEVTNSSGKEALL